MIYDIFQILLWITAIMLFISGIDDLYLDLLYWLQRRKYKKKLPDFSEMFDKPEKPIAIFLGAWNESSVIGRTLSYAVRNLNYANYRFFIGCYPNDPETIRVVQELSKKEPRIIPCINNLDGPTTKADNLNTLYAGLIEYEKHYGVFDIILVHDAEDFIHPNSLKLYNFLLGYKGYHAVQIPVIPIKSKLGKLFHRTYCDAFAEVHTKDMIVRQAMGTFIPFAGTGMGFHRKTFNYLEKYNYDVEMAKVNKFSVDDPFHTEDTEKANIEKTEVKFSEEDLSFYNDERIKGSINVNETSYHDDPFSSLNDYQLQGGKRVPDSVKGYTFMFLAMVLGWISFLVYAGQTDAQQNAITTTDIIEKISFAPSDANAKNNDKNGIINKNELANSKEIKDGIISLSNGFSDKKYNVFYSKNKEKEFTIQESTWISELSAKNRVEVLKSTGIFRNKEIRVQPVIINNETVYRVNISNYDNIDEARDDVAKFKKPVQ
ncbi:MAG: glycosyltransferase [Ignavibacteriota bacterium]|nr:glycosyltransferase [Ignavibacteriota bacterium]